MTVEAQSYGPESIKGIRVVEHIPAGIFAPAAPPTAQPQHKLPTAPAAADSRASNTPVKIAPAQPNASRSATPAARRPLIATPAPIPTAAPVGGNTHKHIATPAVPLSQESLRTLTSRWMKTFYEFDVTSQVNKMDLYANYLQVFTRLGLQQVLELREVIIALR